MAIKQNIKNIFLKIKDLIFPNHIKCIFCDEELNNRSDNETCEECLNSLPFILHACPKCGNPVPEDLDGVCVDCSINSYAFQFARSVFVYKDRVANLIKHIKFDKQVYLIEPVSSYLFLELNKMGITPDYITNVPMFKEKLKARGFNQSELLCKALSRKTKIPCFEFCEKIKDTPQQVSLNFKERRENLKDAFKFKKDYKKIIKDKTILIVDDVFTTGATSNEICKQLLKAGAKSCFVLTLAHSVVEKKL